MQGEIIRRAQALQALGKDIDQALLQNKQLSEVQKLYNAYDALLNPYSVDPALQAPWGIK
jgi:hypothetical protein